jgi:hypothetical protein
MKDILRLWNTKKKKLRKNLHNVIIKFCQLDLDITMHGIAA